MKKVDVFLNLLKGRVRPEGSISPDKKTIKRGGKWVPVKTRKKYSPGDTRTKNGKRYRLQEDGKWKRTKKRKTPSKATNTLAIIKQLGLFFPPDVKDAYKRESVEYVKRDIMEGVEWDITVDDVANHISHPDYIPWETLYHGEAELGLGESFLVAANLGEKVFDEGEPLDRGDRMAIQEVESIMRPARTGMKVFRGVRGGRLYSGLEPGASVPLDWITSTSTSEEVATNIAGRGQGGTIFHLNVPKGTNILITNEYQLEVALSSKYKISVESVSGNVVKGKVVPK